jgi:hypothetical protein
MRVVLLDSDGQHLPEEIDRFLLFKIGAALREQSMFELIVRNSRVL